VEPLCEVGVVTQIADVVDRVVVHKDAVYVVFFENYRFAADLGEVDLEVFRLRWGPLVRQTPRRGQICRLESVFHGENFDVGLWIAERCRGQLSNLL